MKKKKIIIFFLLAMLIIFEISYLKLSKNFSLSSEIPSLSHIEKSRNFWLEEIEKVNPENAYTKLKNAYKSKNFIDQHAAAHLFGEVLYKARGLDGISVCDSSFSYGCYHSFFQAAILDKGVGSIKELDEMCIKKYGSYGTGCQHGIGHGILEYHGHKKLSKSLDACLSIQKFTFIGCSSGVFMEYNYPTLLGPTPQMTRRNFNPNNMYDPCPSVNEKFRKSCYFEQAQWWVNIFNKDYKKIGLLCEDISSFEEKDACFRGLGANIGPDTQYDKKASILACQLMPNLEGKVLCLAGVSWSFYAMPSTQNQAKDICKNLDTQNNQLCISKADLIKEIL